MNRFLVAVMGVLIAVAVGCSSDEKGNGHHASAKDMSADACPHCPGIQKANPDGTCPACGQKVAEPTSSAAPSHHPEAHHPEADKPGVAAAAASKEDACPHCPGIQTANSEGKCPECGMDLAKK
jgi:hypothetical protein